MVNAMTAIVTGASTAIAQPADYPSKPIRLIAGAAAGGTGDVLARVLAEALTPIWKQPAIVENRPGAGGVITMQALQTAPSDSHTIAIAAGSYLTITPFTSANLPYDIERDFTPIAFIAEIPIVIAAGAHVPAKTIPELIAYAQANPGKLTYAANTPGTFPHLTAALFSERAKINLTYIPYKGAGAALPDAMSGRLDLVVEGLAALAGGIKSSGLRPMAVTSIRRMPSLPDVPSIAETLPGFSAIGFYAVMGQAKMPAAIVRKLNDDFKTVLARPDVAAKLADLGNYVRTMSVEELHAFLKSEREIFGFLIKRMGFAPR